MVRILCVLFLLGAANAGAEDQLRAEWTGSDLLANCSAFVKVLNGDKSSKESLEKAGYCYGYLVGISDGLHLMMGVAMQTKSAKNPSLICTPPGTTVGQHARVLVKYLKDHPEHLHKNSGVLSYVAFTDAFPCPPLGSN